MASKQYALFDERFLHSFAGAGIMDDPKVAIVELIANCWDAGAMEVSIKWPSEDGDAFSISDNGHGMSESEFAKRYMTLAYNRTKEQGSLAEIPDSNKNVIVHRPAFGRNGKGRLSAFAFGSDFLVCTSKNGKEIKFKVFIDNRTNQLAFIKESIAPSENTGTTISIQHAIAPKINAEEAIIEIGMRFVADPNFKVKLNNRLISFEDIPDENVSIFSINVPEVGDFEVKVIDVLSTDKSTKLHGIAWHVKNRLVGECTWKGSGNEHLIDGRRTAAKRYTFIINANVLEEAVLSDWTGFNPHNRKYKNSFPIIQEHIRQHLLGLTKEQRDKTYQLVEDANRNHLNKLGIISREKWEDFIKVTQEECPSISVDDLERLGKLLATLEQSRAKYGLIGMLSKASDDDLDDLTTLLNKWDINFAKTVLDEIEQRVLLLERIQSKVLLGTTDEVQDLQPLFKRGLWIFGPEYETIEFTSNQGMTKVIQELYNSNEKGSLNRPDFAIIPDGTVGLYSYPKYDEDGNDIGIQRLTIVELKKPLIPIGAEQKGQAWKYVKELMSKGLVQRTTDIKCFVLGSEVDSLETSRTTENDGHTIIQPLDYDTIIRRAKSRLLMLHSKIASAPFVRDERLLNYLNEKKLQQTLFENSDIPF